MADKIANTPSNNDFTKEYPLQYEGNIVWPILFLLLWFPVGILLLIFNGSLQRDGMRYKLRYRGEQTWLVVWTVLFFPVAVLLAIINGFDIQGISET